MAWYNEAQTLGQVLDVANGALKVEAVTGGNTNVQRVTGGGPAVGQTIKSVAGNLVTTSASAAQTIDTVTAGKTFYITDLSFSQNTATPLDVQIQVAGVVVWEGYISSTNSVSLTGIDSFPAGAATQLVRIFVVNGVAASALDYFVAGFEQ